jgi:hypothetical protein
MALSASVQMHEIIIRLLSTDLRSARMFQLGIAIHLAHRARTLPGPC